MRLASVSVQTFNIYVFSKLNFVLSYAGTDIKSFAKYMFFYFLHAF